MKNNRHVMFVNGYLEGRKGLIAKEGEFGLLVYVFNVLHPDEIELSVWVDPRAVCSIDAPVDEFALVSNSRMYN